MYVNICLVRFFCEENCSTFCFTKRTIITLHKMPFRGKKCSLNIVLL